MGFIAKDVFKSPQTIVMLEKDIGIGYNKFMIFKDSYDDKLDKILSKNNHYPIENY